MKAETLPQLVSWLESQAQQFDTMFGPTDQAHNMRIAAACLIEMERGLTAQVNHLSSEVRRLENEMAQGIKAVRGE